MFICAFLLTLPKLAQSTSFEQSCKFHWEKAYCGKEIVEDNAIDDGTVDSLFGHYKSENKEFNWTARVDDDFLNLDSSSLSIKNADYEVISLKVRVINEEGFEELPIPIVLKVKDWYVFPVLKELHVQGYRSKGYRPLVPRLAFLSRHLTRTGRAKNWSRKVYHYEWEKAALELSGEDPVEVSDAETAGSKTWTGSHTTSDCGTVVIPAGLDQAARSWNPVRGFHDAGKSPLNQLEAQTRIMYWLCESPECKKNGDVLIDCGAKTKGTFVLSEQKRSDHMGQSNDGSDGNCMTCDELRPKNAYAFGERVDPNDRTTFYLLRKK